MKLLIMKDIFLLNSENPCINRKFSTKLTMRRHMGIHQGDKPFECPHCHYCTRLKASLIQHLRVHTGTAASFHSHVSWASAMFFVQIGPKCCENVTLVRF